MIEAGGSDSLKSISELDADEVDRRAGLECYEGGELISHWIGFGDGALGQHGQDRISRKSSGRSYGMRGDSLGLGHIAGVQGGAGRARIGVAMATAGI